MLMHVAAGCVKVQGPAVFAAQMWAWVEHRGPGHRGVCEAITGKAGPLQADMWPCGHSFPTVPL